MGCCSSSSSASEPVPAFRVVEEAEPVSDHAVKRLEDRIEKLQALDGKTKVPFILVELTGEADGKGNIGVCGKDEYGVYDSLSAFFIEQWECIQPEKESIEMSGLLFSWPGYRVSEDGINNMSRSIMKLVDFMCGQLSWTLAAVSSGSFAGSSGDAREMQVIFKAPHPMNLVTSHVMLEIRGTGHIQICADIYRSEDESVLDTIDGLLTDRFQAEPSSMEEEFCDRCYQVPEASLSADEDDGASSNRFGLLSTVLCDTVVQTPGWSLVASLAGTPWGSQCREQQLVFRKDHHPLGDSSYVTVVLNDGGLVEVYGKDIRGAATHFAEFAVEQFQCEEQQRTAAEDGTLCIRYAWSPQDLLSANAEIIRFFEMEGFETQVCTQYVINVESGGMQREQQLLFRPGKTDVGTIEPHIVFNIFAGEGKEEFYEDPEKPTQVLAKQQLSLAVVQPDEDTIQVEAALDGIDDFVINYLGGSKAGERQYHLDVFMSRGWYENNLSQWTMRLCDIMVDQLGWSFVTCSLCNTGVHGHIREQQLIFHYEGEQRELPPAVSSNLVNQPMEELIEMPKPAHWCSNKVLNGMKTQETVSCSQEEIEGLQMMCDETFKRTLTRDRAPDDDAPEDEEMPYRLEVLHAFRSENLLLHQQLTEKAAELQSASGPAPKDFRIKTSSVEFPFAPSEEGFAYLFHGTNPSSAMSIVKTGFQIANAGTNVGTMFGNGVYLSERSAKADEYAKDDGGNTYPGLRALLFCRCYIGCPYVATTPGEQVEQAQINHCDCVLGDREASAGTYREFVFWNAAQVYPEFVIIYRRQYDRAQVPENMRQPTTGTTGRFWQFRGDAFGFKGWKNVPPEVNKQLIAASQSSTKTLKIAMRGNSYMIDLEEKVIHKGSKTSPLRPPMTLGP